MNIISRPLIGAGIWKGIVFPVLVASSALAIAFIGATLIGDDSGIDGVNGFVEALSGRSNTFLGDIGFLAPLGFAFAAGTAAAFNPCGFAMLPAYMGLYLGTNSEDADANVFRNLGKALVVGGAMTAGFVLLFAGGGLVIAVGARSLLTDILPWLGLTIGIFLTIAGSWLLGGGKFYMGLATRVASRMGNPGDTNVKGYFLFGLGYGTASLGCTLPIFLTVIGTSFAASSIATSFGQFILYALGMGAVIMVLTLAMALFKGAMVSTMRKIMPYVEPVGTWLMIVAGAYIVFYWLTLGDLLV